MTRLIGFESLDNDDDLKINKKTKQKENNEEIKKKQEDDSNSESSSTEDDEFNVSLAKMERRLSQK